MKAAITPQNGQATAFKACNPLSQSAIRGERLAHHHWLRSCWFARNDSGAQRGLSAARAGTIPFHQPSLRSCWFARKDSGAQRDLSAARSGHDSFSPAFAHARSRRSGSFGQASHAKAVSSKPRSGGDGPLNDGGVLRRLELAALARSPLGSSVRLQGPARTRWLGQLPRSGLSDLGSGLVSTRPLPRPSSH